MITFDEALELIGKVTRPMQAETVPLEHAAGRVLAAPVTARIDSPRSDVSAMDGYAVREADLDRVPARLAVVGESFAGCGWSGAIGDGQCVRIFTGAPMPKGADRVVIQENVTRDGDLAIVKEHPGISRHVRPRCGDFAKGEVLASVGRLLDPRAVVAVAAADVAAVEVFARPRITILGTGDELAEPGTAAARDDAIPESVSFGVSALATNWGGQVCGRLRLRDSIEAMQAAARSAAAQSDLVIVTGGASVGAKDFAKRMFEPLGLDLVFSRIAIKPGKPVWLGRAGDALILGLPGNPGSAMVTARLLLAPLLYGLTGRSPSDALHWSTAPLSAPLQECGPRETFHRARWAGERVDIISNQDSSAQKVLAEADLLVRQRANAPRSAAGDFVETLFF